MHFKTVPNDGYYLATVVASFGANANGYREIYIANTTTNTVLGRMRSCAITGDNTIIQVFSGIVIGPGEGVGVYGSQNSGTEIDITTFLTFTKVLPYFPELIESSGKY